MQSSTSPAQSAAIIEAILRRVRDIPTLPTMVDSIIEKLNTPNAAASEVAKFISYDPGLTSKFLRIVNSSAYGFQRQISSIQHAVMILGFGQVRGIVLSTSIVKLFASQTQTGLDTKTFWKHSLQTAAAARALAEHHKVPYAEDAFSAGILHDIGKITLDAYFGAEYSKVIAAARTSRLLQHGEPYQALERSIIGLDHAELGYHLALRWRLPHTFKEVIRYHHNPSQAQDATGLVYSVALANAFSRLFLFNAGVFNAAWISDEVLDYYRFDPENPEPFLKLYDLACQQMADVEELLSVIQG